MAGELAINRHFILSSCNKNKKKCKNAMKVKKYQLKIKSKQLLKKFKSHQNGNLDFLTPRQTVCSILLYRIFLYRLFVYLVTWKLGKRIFDNQAAVSMIILAGTLLL